jgi:hypothetical protein
MAYKSKLILKVTPFEGIKYFINLEAIKEANNLYTSCGFFFILRAFSISQTI